MSDTKHLRIELDLTVPDDVDAILQKLAAQAGMAPEEYVKHAFWAFLENLNRDISLLGQGGINTWAIILMLFNGPH